MKHYFRYMDDIVIFGSSKEELHALKREIDVYFMRELRLTIKGNWQVFPSYVRGVDFVGYRTFLNYTLLRKSSCTNFKKKMVAIREKTASGQMMNYSEWCSVNSYKGWLKHCDSYRLPGKSTLHQFKTMQTDIIGMLSKPKNIKERRRKTWLTMAE